ncbi:uncharacterized protein EDB93DRAFT_1245732 [Suillus bovinus]|uniref:uncharacterized protein n=1 Tax=Suillus bovinus TaxID=48563 RepID=UPI001B87A65F|nr:uncharacterized protein EDB93DRAFT_1245732 [Suillus bovinus]KAG2159179.1 hypothetical protein EDB93DRAFT_1245732 [Suillus bovinus]
MPVAPRPHNVCRLLSKTRCPYVKISKELQQQLAEHRRAKRLDEDQEIQAVLNYLEMKATELALKFKQPRCHYLEHFSLGSAPHRRKHNKTSAWHAFLHFKGANNERSNIVDLVKDKAEYHSLKKAEKETLIKEFNQVKASTSQCPPTITARSRAAECARSFQFVKEELDALKQRVGIEAIVLMVRGVSDFAMAPKAFFSSAAAEQFVCLYLQKDIAQLATEFESTILANGVILSELTGDAKASVEFKHYEVRVVQRYLVKLVGWNHPQWLNPSDLKGGLDALEKRRIAAGEKLTPELEPLVPLNDIPLDNIPLDNILPSAASSQATQADHDPFDNTSSTEVRLPTEDHTTQQASPTALAHTSTSINSSSIPDDRIDPVLRTSDNSSATVQPFPTSLAVSSPPSPTFSPVSTPPSPPSSPVPTPTSSTSPPVSPPRTPPIHASSAVASQTTAEDSVLMATTNTHKWVQVQPSEGQSGREKCARKLTERAQAFWDDSGRDNQTVPTAASGRRKKQRVSKQKSSQLVPSDLENA